MNIIFSKSMDVAVTSEMDTSSNAAAFEIEMEDNHQASVREAQEIILKEDEEAIELSAKFETNFSTQHALTYLLFFFFLGFL
jgi:hypothetical protein